MGIMDRLKGKPAITSTTVQRYVGNLTIQDLARIDEEKLQEAIKLRRQIHKQNMKESERRKAKWQPLLNEQDKIEEELNLFKEKMKSLPIAKRLDFMPRIVTLTDRYNQLGRKVANTGCGQIRFLRKIPDNSIAWLEYCKGVGEES